MDSERKDLMPNYDDHGFDWFPFLGKWRGHRETVRGPSAKWEGKFSLRCRCN